MKLITNQPKYRPVKEDDGVESAKALNPGMDVYRSGNDGKVHIVAGSRKTTMILSDGNGNSCNAMLEK